uniref:Uncharacterized protein n=1 Tax=Anguilla anguilla TaxID=7936 RepID=A0A0E9QH38_ANGAN
MATVCSTALPYFTIFGQWPVRCFNDLFLNEVNIWTSLTLTCREPLTHKSLCLCVCLCLCLLL